MRAAFVLADVLVAEPDGLESLKAMDEAGLRTVILAPVTPAGGRLDTGGLPLVACNPDDPECWGDEPGLIFAAARRAETVPAEAYLVCHNATDLARAAASGCRPVLVLAGRTLQAAYGQEEPLHKDAMCVPDLGTASRYMLEEAGHDAVVGPFPYAPASSIDEMALSQGPTRREIVRLMLFVVAAGVALSLGIAYFLQEIYQVITFPPIVYYLTLQWIPQTWRGALFLGVGAAIVLLAILELERRPGRRRRDT